MESSSLCLCSAETACSSKACQGLSLGYSTAKLKPLLELSVLGTSSVESDLFIYGNLNMVLPGSMLTISNAISMMTKCYEMGLRAHKQLR